MPTPKEHLPCPDCNGNLLFDGIRNGEKIYRCCVCLKEFKNDAIPGREDMVREVPRVSHPT